MNGSYDLLISEWHRIAAAEGRPNSAVRRFNISIGMLADLSVDLREKFPDQEFFTGVDLFFVSDPSLDRRVVSIDFDPEVPQAPPIQLEEITDVVFD